jgi:glycosyltransferase involved in cell wall biosynthesis
MRVQIVDPSGDVTPYDHALSAALARRGAEVELVTSRFLYGPLPAHRDYAVSEAFYRRATRRGLDARRSRRAVKLLEHVPDMLRYRRRSPVADVRHFEWLPLEGLDWLLLPSDRPRVMTMHNVRRRGAGRAAVGVTRRLAERMDAVVVHTRDAERLLVARIGVDPGRVRVIPHGAFDHLTRQVEEEPLPAELASVEGPVVLCFGTIRPYKGIELLLEAFRGIEGAELWIVGRPLAIDLAPLRELARGLPVRFVTRYLSDAELPALFRRADLVALPHPVVDQSGVLFVALAFGKPIVAADVGGFGEIAREHGAARLAPAGDPAAMREAIEALLADPRERAALGARAAAAAAGPYSWDEVARRTLALYEELLA